MKSVKLRVLNDDSHAIDARGGRAGSIMTWQANSYERLRTNNIELHVTTL